MSQPQNLGGAQRPHEAEEAEIRAWGQLEQLICGVSQQHGGNWPAVASGFPISPCGRAGLCMLTTPHEVYRTVTVAKLNGTDTGDQL